MTVKKQLKAKKDKSKSVEPKNPKETGSREKAILQALEENPSGLTVEEIGAKAREIFNIKRKAWGHAIWQLKHDGKSPMIRKSRFRGC